MDTNLLARVCVELKQNALIIFKVVVSRSFKTF